jgi:hypothetical protein
MTEQDKLVFTPAELDALLKQIRDDEREAALAQPAQEPVAWWIVSKTTGKKSVISQPNEWPDIYWEKHPLYTTPPQRIWVGLTEEEMKRTCYEVFSYDPYTVARAIEAKLREKNMGSFTED